MALYITSGVPWPSTPADLPEETKRETEIGRVQAVSATHGSSSDAQHLASKMISLFEKMGGVKKT